MQNERNEVNRIELKSQSAPSDRTALNWKSYTTKWTNWRFGYFISRPYL